MAYSSLQDEGQAPADHVDLDRHKDKFTRLYIEEKRTLRDVMDILEKEDGCIASANMYQRFIRKHNIRKNSTRERMIERLQEIEAQRSRGGPISSHVHEHRIEEQAVQRYFSLNFGFQTLDSAIAGILHRDLDNPNGPNKGLITWQGARPRLSRTISQPDILQQSSELLNLVQTWHEMTFTGLKFPPEVFGGSLDDNSENIKSVQQLRKPYLAGPLLDVPLAVQNAAMVSINSLDDAEPDLAFASLQRALSSIRTLLLDPHPNTVIYIFKIAYVAVKHNHLVVVRVLLRHIYDHSKIIYGPHHVLTRLTALLARQFDSVDLLESVINLVYHTTRAIIGPDDMWTLWIYNQIIVLGVGESGMSINDQSDRFENAIHQLATCQNASTFHDGVVLLLNCRRSYCRHLEECGDFDKLETILREDVDHLEHGDSSDLERDREAIVSIFTHYINLLVCQGKIKEAEEMAELGMARFIKQAPSDYPLKVYLVSRYVRFHVEISKKMSQKEAEELQASLMKPYRLVGGAEITDET